MAAGMFQVTAKDLIDYLKKIPENEVVGYVMSVQDGVCSGAPLNQSILLYRPLPGTKL